MDWLDTLVDGSVFALIFGLIAAVCLLFGLHAMIIDATDPDRTERLLLSFPFAFGLMLILCFAVIAGTFCLFFLAGAATLTGIGLPIYGIGLVAVLWALYCWTRLVQRKGK
jgi:hypothetical protein